MAKFGKNRFPPNYQNGVGWNCEKGSRPAIAKQLHDNSIELCDILDKNKIIKDNMNIFEIGAGPARNLKYIYDKNNTINMYINDLFKDSSVSNMHEDVKDLVTFYELDTLSLVEDFEPDFGVDLLISSDHLMHVEYESVDKILKKIRDNWKPKNILFREVRKEFETPEHPRLFHDYQQLLSDYELIHESKSGNSDEFFIWLLERK